MSASWRCRAGLHRWFLDCAMFTAGMRCDDCLRWKNEQVGAEVVRERLLWAKYSKNQDPLDDNWERVKARVAQALEMRETP